MKLRIAVNEQYSTPTPVSTAQSITPAADTVASFQGSNDELNWTSIANNRFLPAGVPTIIPSALRPYAHFRLAVAPEPIHREFTVNQVATDVDLVVPDLIKTRSTIIERDEAGSISKIIKEGGREITVDRDEAGNVEEIDDGTRTWTVSRDEAGNIEEVTVGAAE